MGVGTEGHGRVVSYTQRSYFAPGRLLIEQYWSIIGAVLGGLQLQKGELFICPDGAL